jgi:hypothetical protein
MTVHEARRAIAVKASAPARAGVEYVTGVPPTVINRHADVTGIDAVGGGSSGRGYGQ